MSLFFACLSLFTLFVCLSSPRLFILLLVYSFIYSFLQLCTFCSFDLFVLVVAYFLICVLSCLLFFCLFFSRLCLFADVWVRGPLNAFAFFSHFVCLVSIRQTKRYLIKNETLLMKARALPLLHFLFLCLFAVQVYAR